MKNKSAERGKKNRTIKVDCLARVEGEGALEVRFKGEQLTDVKFKIFEPPRFFEAFLRGRHFTEAPDITARICGICPIAYQMSAVHAMENAFGIKVTGPLRDLRRLIYCGEWIESHALHVFMLHAPDFLGYDDAIQMAKDYPDQVKMGLRLKKAGNSLVTLLGGREIHPINVRVGGFYRAPAPAELAPISEELKWARDAALETVRWTAALPMPDFEQNIEFVALRHPEEYPFNEGRLVSTNGLNIDVSEYPAHFAEEHVPYSNALHSVRKEHGAYLTGPAARFNLNFDRLSPAAQQVAAEAGISPPCRNPFQSIIIRAVEIFWACDEALRLIARYEQPDRPFIEIQVPDDPAGPSEWTGHGCTEAPRGILYHRYRVNREGFILDAHIVPPTAQNQKAMEQDLWELIPPRRNWPNDKLQWACEQAIRNYDPCISCATHFLDFRVHREP